MGLWGMVSACHQSRISSKLFQDAPLGGWRKEASDGGGGAMAATAAMAAEETPQKRWIMVE